LAARAAAAAFCAASNWASSGVMDGVIIGGGLLRSGPANTEDAGGRELRRLVLRLLRRALMLVGMLVVVGGVELGKNPDGVGQLEML